MRTPWLSFLLITAFLTSSCGNQQSANASRDGKISFSFYDIASSSGSREPAEQATLVTDTGGGGGGGGGRNENQPAVMEISETSQQSVVPTDRKIIRNAEIALESDSPEESQNKITAIAQSMGGFLVESQQSSSDARSATRDVIQLTLRVPADKFTEALDEIRKTAKRVVIETVKGQDVTEQFIDIEAQLKAKKALELQFMEIMKRANTVADALEVHTQLAEVRGEIEKIEGRKRFLENQTALSTIKVNLQSPAAISASSAGFGYRLTDSFGRGIEIALNFILGLITFLIGILPFALFIGLPAFFIGRYYWRRNARKRTASEIAKEEITVE